MILVALLCLTLCAAGCSPDRGRVGEVNIDFHRVTEAPLQQDTTEEVGAILLVLPPQI